MIFTPYYDIVRWRTQDLSYERRMPAGGSGGSRIFLGGGRAPTPKVGVLTYFFPKNCMKMKEFGHPRGGGASLAPPLDPPLEGINPIFCILSQKYHGIKENLVRKVRPGAPH